MSSITRLLLVGQFTTKNVQSGRSFMHGTVGVEECPESLFDIYINNLNSMQGDVLRKLEDMPSRTTFGAKRVIVDKVARKVVVTHNWKIFYKVADFEFPEELVENFLHPPVISISEVKASPSKKRVSVTGNVGEIGDVRNVSGGKRLRTIMLNDGDEAIRLSLWEEHTDIPFAVNQQIKAECVVITEWNNTKQLESTPALHVETVARNDEDMTGEIVAVTCEDLEVPYEMVFVVDGTEYEVTVTEQSVIQVNMQTLPVRGILSTRQEGMVMECVRLRQIMDTD